MGKQTDIDINEVVDKAVKRAIQEYNKQMLIEKKKKVFHNTRLLMKHYNELKDHVTNAIDSSDEVELDWIDIESMDKDKLYIQSIKKSKIKTLIMIAHIDASLSMLKQKQIEQGSIERFEALKMFYIEGASYEDIQEKFQCGKNTPGRWINQMINELSVYLFGVDGLKLDMVQ